jgi:hypothetical protein
MTPAFDPTWLVGGELYAEPPDVDASPEVREAYERGLANKRRRRRWSKAQRSAYLAGREPVTAPTPWLLELILVAVETVLAALPERTVGASARDGEEGASVPLLQLSTFTPVIVSLGTRLVRSRAQRWHAAGLGLTGATAPRLHRDTKRALVNSAFSALVSRRLASLGPAWARKLVLTLAADYLQRRSWAQALRVPTEDVSIMGGSDEHHGDDSAAAAPAKRVRRRSKTSA